MYLCVPLLLRILCSVSDQEGCLGYCHWSVVLKILECSKRGAVWSLCHIYSIQGSSVTTNTGNKAEHLPCTDPSGISLSVGITWAEISVKESGPMSNIWKRGSVPTGGFLVAVACATPAENVGPVLVPVDWVLVLSVCKIQSKTTLQSTVIKKTYS